MIFIKSKKRIVLRKERSVHSVGFSGLEWIWLATITNALHDEFEKDNVDALVQQNKHDK